MHKKGTPCARPPGEGCAARFIGVGSGSSGSRCGAENGIRRFVDPPNPAGPGPGLWPTSLGPPEIP